MVIDFDDEQKYLVLKALGEALLARSVKGEDLKGLQDLVSKIQDSLRDEGKLAIFQRVFQEFEG